MVKKIFQFYWAPSAKMMDSDSNIVNLIGVSLLSIQYAGLAYIVFYLPLHYLSSFFTDNLNLGRDTSELIAIAVFIMTGAYSPIFYRKYIKK